MGAFLFDFKLNSATFDGKSLISMPHFLFFLPSLPSFFPFFLCFYFRVLGIEPSTLHWAISSSPFLNFLRPHLIKLLRLASDCNSSAPASHTLFFLDIDVNICKMGYLHSFILPTPYLFSRLVDKVLWSWHMLNQCYSNLTNQVKQIHIQKKRQNENSQAPSSKTFQVHYLQHSSKVDLLSLIMQLQKLNLRKVK